MPDVKEKLASQLGALHSAVVMPYLPGTMEIGEMAHVAGYYAGIAYAAAAPPVVSATAIFRPIFRSGTRRR